MSGSIGVEAIGVEPRVLLVAYKIRAGTGSEDGSGYHIVGELVRRGCRMTLISRENNIALLRDDPSFSGVTLVGVDVPRALGFFKRGGRGIILYYYLWQVFVGARVRGLTRETRFDVVHQLNFHTDWAPHFLGRSGTPVVWGPIGHHRLAPRSFFPSRDRVGFAREIVRAAVKRAFWYLDPFLRLAARRTQTILYANDDLAPPFRRHAAKITIRPYAGSFAPQGGESPPTDDVFRALWIGRFIPLKGLLPAIEAFAAFHRTNQPERPTELVLVGSGPLREHALQLAADNRIASYVRVIPWLPQQELTDLYASSTVFLYPSLEAQGLVVAEALSFGLPVIAIADTGPGFLTGRAGWTVDRDGLVAGLAAALSDAYESWQTDRLADTRKSARERYDSYLDWRRIGDALMVAYARTRQRYAP